MAHLLHVDSSLFADSSVSKSIAQTFRETWAQEHPGGLVTYRDLGANPVSPLTEAAISASFVPAEQRSEEQVAGLLAREELVEELLRADAYLFGVPMYNWGVSGSFKVWLDQVILVGTTAGGDQPPLAGRPATVVLSYGGGYFPGTPREGWDFVKPYLETVLGKAMGLDLSFVTAQLTLAERNPAMAEFIQQAKEIRAQAHQDAEQSARDLAARFGAVAA